VRLGRGDAIYLPWGAATRLLAVWGCTPGRASGHESKIKLVEDGGCFGDELSVKLGTMPSHRVGEHECDYSSIWISTVAGNNNNNSYYTQQGTRGRRLCESHFVWMDR
jgi:hypothetical protein